MTIFALHEEHKKLPSFLHPTQKAGKRIAKKKLRILFFNNGKCARFKSYFGRVARRQRASDDERREREFNMFRNDTRNEPRAFIGAL